MEPTPTTPETPKAPHKVGTVPERDVAQVAMWSAVGDTWTGNPQITLVDCTPAQYVTAAAAQATKLKARQDADNNRPLLSNRLDAIRHIFDAAVPYIKADLLKVFKKEGQEAAYPSFGLSQRAGIWQLPEERVSAQDDYDTLVAALATQGLKDGEYGSEILKPLAGEFRTKYAKLVKMDKDISDKVGDKNLGKPWLKRQTKRLRYVLKGNYPETYDQVARAWGIQKEKF